MFKDKKYVVVKKMIPKEVANFLHHYLLRKRQTVKFLMDNDWFSPFDQTWGSWDDAQMPNTYSHYSDMAMETLLQRVKFPAERSTGLKLVETYSYVRVYKQGDILHRHKDRPSCEISCTLNLGGDEWPIYLDPTGQSSVLHGSETTTVLKSNPNKGTKIVLRPGDGLIYSGCDLEHWREPFDGLECSQVFLHYNNLDGDFQNKNSFDSRPMLGLPSSFKRGN